MSNNLEIALAKEACLACGTLIDGPILINNKLTHKAAQEVKNFHGKCIGFSDELCPKCKEYASKGLLCVEIDEKLSEPNNPYRTGFLFVLDNNSDMAKYFRNMPEFLIKKGDYEFIFLTTEVVEWIKK